MGKSITYNAQTKTTEIIETPDLPIDPMPAPPTIEERLETVETDIGSVIEALDAIFGGV